MRIEVVGTGCASCKRLHEMTERVAKEIIHGASVEYVSNDAGVKRLLELGLMQSPALVVNGKVALTGATGDAEEIRAVILANR